MPLTGDQYRPNAACESLNRQLEDAWCKLADLRNGARLHAYLTPSGRLLLRREAVDEPQGVGVGEYGACVRLVDFRAAVFAAFERLRRKP